MTLRNVHVILDRYIDVTLRITSGKKLYGGPSGPEQLLKKALLEAY